MTRRSEIYHIFHQETILRCRSGYITTTQILPSPIEYSPVNYLLLSPQPLSNNPRVVGGLAATHRWPWQVLLIDQENGRPFCGGVLIGTQHVLTAAHCFDDHVWVNVDVVLGEYDRSIHEGTEQIYNIDCLTIHDGYENQVPYHNDIAIITLDLSDTNDGNTINITENVLPICLPSKGEFTTNSMCYVTGWGYTGFENMFARNLPTKLQEAEVPLINSQNCQTAYGTQLTRRMQCAGFLEGVHRADTCKGDSGGPLVCQDESGNFKLWGITSWGDNYFCTVMPSGPAPGVYTRVDRYLKWIKDKIDRGTCS
ncbi:serine protease 1-like [Amphiura filiformis]|uniref:serine protease 1-like n=1 Tax=Amphiura filiformis TaxID=82378 RepID=UPI003B221607